jgi:hypothetical protein
MPYVPGHEEDGFLKKLDITPADIEPKAERCTQVRIYIQVPTTLINEKISPFGLTNLNNEFVSHRVDADKQIFVWHTQTKSNSPANRTTASGKRYKGTNIDMLQEWIV